MKSLFRFFVKLSILRIEQFLKEQKIINSVLQLSRSVISDSVTPWTAAHQASLSINNSGVHSNSCPSSQWCHPAISSSAVPFSSCPQSFPASGSFPMSQFFTSGGQNIGVSASASVLSINTQDWSPLGWTAWISLQSRGFSSLLQHHSSKASILQHPAFFIVQLSHPNDYWKNHSFD